MACSIDLMPTGSSLMRSTHASSHGAGQIRPVNSGKLLVECRTSIALPILPVNEVVPVRDDVVDRAAALAKRDAAIHATRALQAGGIVREPQVELAVMFLARLGSLVRFLEPLVLEEPGDLPR